MTSVPFSINEHLGGLAEYSGILKLETASILADFQSKDPLIGVLKSKVRKVKNPFEKIESIAFKKSLFGSKLFLRVSDYDLYSAIPNPGSGELLLRIRRKHSLDANELVSAVQLGIPDQKIKRIEEHFSE